MKKRISHNQATADEENPYWLSFSDLMSGLLLIFILAVVALLIDLTQKNKLAEEARIRAEIAEKEQMVLLEKQKKLIEELKRRSRIVESSIEELKKSEWVRKTIIHKVRDELARQKIVVEIADNESVIRIPESTLSFKSGSDEIPETRQRAVNEIGIVLSKVITEYDGANYLDTVFIEGHTDSDAIFYNKKGNWGLSTNRAISVWKFWENQSNIHPKLGTVLNHRGEKLFSMSGYAETRRVDEKEETNEGKRRNRRIDIRLTVKKPSLIDLENIKKIIPDTQPKKE